MKILLDENMPESLLAALEDLGQQVDSVNHLKLKGLSYMKCFIAKSQGTTIFVLRETLVLPTMFVKSEISYR